MKCTCCGGMNANFRLSRSIDVGDRKSAKMAIMVSMMTINAPMIEIGLRLKRRHTSCT